ncbi:MAG: LamB/YcsF family protein [Rhodothermales bacterium]|nr:LamB/YcsF family protein [Rhodothermales bacterium]MBO6778324.1 LamB/YcsF family protein [Rhodothermales bacterium]
MLLNCDMGESFGPWQKGRDAEVMPLIDWANIACGGHAGDPDTMARTLALAAEHNVRAGAHPGYPDKRHFGRLRIDMPIDTLVHEVQAQIGALQAVARAEGVTLHHVKPHGALYNAMMEDWGLLVRLGQAVAAVDPSLVFVLQATPDRDRHALALQNTGLQLAFEAFADRRYRSDGRLQSRRHAGSVLEDPEEVERHVEMLLAGTVQTPDGPLQIRADTLCVHGDNPVALEAVRRVRALIPRSP